VLVVPTSPTSCVVVVAVVVATRATRDPLLLLFFKELAHIFCNALLVLWLRAYANIAVWLATILAGTTIATTATTRPFRFVCHISQTPTTISHSLRLRHV